MTSYRSPRAEILAGSRVRSGSILSDEGSQKDGPASSRTSSVNSSSSSNMEGYSAADSALRGRLNVYGSNVSKMKERFQQQESRKPEEPRSLSAGRVSESDCSPEIKRKKTSEMQSSGSLQGENSQPSLHDAANHVQRFMYTRALFARMEEKNRPPVEPVQLTKPRKLSPSPAGPLSPALSPDHSKSSSSKDNNWPAPDISSKEEPGHDGVKSRFEPKSSYSAFSNMAGGLLWKRRQYESRANPDYGKKDDSGRQNGETLNVLSRGYDRNLDSRKIMSEENLLSSSSKQEVNETSTRRSRSDSLETANTSQHSSYEGDKRPVTLPRNYKPSESVVMRQKKFDNDTRRDSAKRLSKEEIQAAINKADSYLTHKTDSNSDFQSKRRSWELREQMSDISEGSLYGWTKSKNQRLSRSTDCLDNRTNEPLARHSDSERGRSSKSADPVTRDRSLDQVDRVPTLTSPSRQIPGVKPPIPSKPSVLLTDGSGSDLPLTPLTGASTGRRQSPVPKRTAPPPPNKAPPSLPRTTPASLSPSSDNVSEPDKPSPVSESFEKISSNETNLDPQSVNDISVPNVSDTEGERPYQNVASSKSGLLESTSQHKSEREQRTLLPKDSDREMSAQSPSSVISSKGVDSESDLYEPVIPKCHLPPPPPYPNPPPPPYQSHVSPPNSSSLPSMVDQIPASHHYENVKSSTYANQENSQEARNGETTPPVQKRTAKGLTNNSDNYTKTRWVTPLHTHCRFVF